MIGVTCCLEMVSKIMDPHHLEAKVNKVNPVNSATASVLAHVVPSYGPQNDDDRL